MAKPKQPHPSHGKKVTPTNLESLPAQPAKLSFSFEYHDDQFPVQSCDHHEMTTFLDRLWQLSRLTWNEVYALDHRKSGCEPILIKQMEAARPASLTPDVDRLLVFRFNGTNCRLAGFRKGDVLQIVWVDPKLRLYKHG